MRRIWNVIGNLVILAAVAALAVVLVRFGGVRGEQPAPSVGVFQSPLGPTPLPPLLPTVTVVGTPTATVTPTQGPTPLTTDTPTPPIPTPALPPLPMKPGGFRVENITVVGERQLITQQEGYIIGAGWAWSPDSKQLLFVKRDPKKLGRVLPQKGGPPIDNAPPITDIWMFDVSAGSSRRIATGILPEWSVDGNRIFYTQFVSADPGVFRKKIESVDLLGKDKRELVSTFAEGGAASWLSEDSAIVVRDDVLYLVDLNSDTQKQLSELRINTRNANDPVASPDGKKVVFVEEGTHNLWLVNLEQAKSYLLTDRFCNIRWGVGWSWDSQRVAFSSSYGGIAIIHIANANRTAETRIILEEGRYRDFDSFSLTPEGNVLFFSTGDRVYIVNADGTGLRSITEEIDLTLFRLSPDASKLAINKCLVPDNCALYIMDLAGQ